MPQGVVDLLELVEVDEVDGAHVVWPPLAQRQLHAVMQDGAVGQSGQRIEAGQMIDLGLGDPSLGDVLHQDDHATVFHRLQGEFERASALSIRRFVKKCSKEMGGAANSVESQAICMSTT